MNQITETETSIIKVKNDKNQLHAYLKHIFDLEVSLYEIGQTCNNVQKEIYRNENWKPDAPLEHKSVPGIDWAEKFQGPLYGGAIAGALIAIVLMVISGIGFGAMMAIVFIGAAVGIGISIYSDLNEQNKVLDYNRTIDAQNYSQQENAKKHRDELEQKNSILNKYVQMLSQSYHDTKRVLDSFYSTDIIYKKYQNLVAISSFIEYIESGRCTELEGHEGAYNIFENEIRQNLIIRKLDEVIAKLNTIEDNQYLLYSAIQDSNRTINQLYQKINTYTEHVKSIEQNTDIIAYNSNLTARNTEYLAWVEFLKN